MICLLGAVGATHGIIFSITADPAYNTNAPSGALADSGWQYEGQWGGFLGTPIAPTFFLAAQHVGGSTGQVFRLNGFDYHAVGFSNVPGTDLRVWRVAETFPFYAPLFTGTNEVGLAGVAFGRGTQRGAAVVVNGQTNGWRWGAADGVQRWGENAVAGIVAAPGLGDLLRCDFDRGAASSNECHLSSGDSSGALFLQDGGAWKLAGIHYGVDGPFSYSSDGSNSFNAALLDARGLFVADGGSWTYIPTNGPADEPSSFYCTRVSANVGAIRSAIHFEPAADLRITAVTRVGGDLQVSLATASNRLYRLDRRADLTGGAWVNVTNNLLGSGAVMTVVDAGAGDGAPRFYRVRLNP